MKKAYLELGYVCNNLCRHCFVPQTQRKHDLTTDNVKRILDKLNEDNYDTVAFTGGEPTIRGDLFELVKYAKSIGLKNIELQTNGRMMYYLDFAKKIKKAGFSKVYISIHSHIPEHHDYLTQVKGSWKQTMGGIKNAVNLGIPLMTNTVINKVNYKDVPDLVNLLSSIGIREIELDFIRYIGNAKVYFNDLKIRMTDVWSYLKKTFDMSKTLPIDMIYIDDYPLCLMKGYEEFNADSFGEEGEVHDEDAKHYNVDFKDGQLIHENQKIYLDRCSKCKYRNKCQGIWKEYIDYFGDDEFRPII